MAAGRLSGVVSHARCAQHGCGRGSVPPPCHALLCNTIHFGSFPCPSLLQGKYRDQFATKNHNPKNYGLMKDKTLFFCPSQEGTWRHKFIIFFSGPACPLSRGSFLSKSFLAIGKKKGCGFVNKKQKRLDQFATKSHNH